MAFATDNVRSCYIGGNLKLTVGEWTGSAGDAAGTMTIEAGKIYMAQFLPNVTSTAREVNIAVSQSVSAALSTVTVYNSAAVTAGTFSIISA